MGLPNREAGFYDFLVNFTMLQDYFYMRHVDAVYWSLSYEVTFYFFITLLLIFKRANNAHYYLLPLLLISFAFYAGLFELPFRVAKFLMLKHIGQFIAGIIFYRMYTGSINGVSTLILLATALLNYFIYPWIDATFVLSFYVLFYFAIKGKLTWIRSPVFLWLGSISYSLYLLHQNLGYIIMHYVYSLGGSGWMAIVIAFATMLILSTLVVKLIEQPGGRWMKRKLTNKFG